MVNWRMHPDESDLLRYCDGELRAKEAARVTQHLQACWDCRTRLDDLKYTIAEFVHYRRDVWEPALPQPPQPWKNLRAEFARVGQSDAGGGWRRIFERRAVWLVAGTLTAGTGIFFYALRQPPPAPVAVVSRAPAAVVQPSVPHIAPPRKTVTAPGPEDELRVIAALGRIGADLGDPIEISRTRDRIVVTCMGLDAHRMQEVRLALAGLPRVSVELAPKPAASTAGSPLDVVGAPPDMPAAHEKFVDELLKSSEDMIARAHALRRLALRFPANVVAGMSADSQALLAAIRDHHASALRREVLSLARAARPYLGVAPPAQPSIYPPHEDWQARTTRLLAEAQQVDRLLGAVFAGSQGAPRPGADLMAALAKLESDVAP